MGPKTQHFDAIVIGGGPAGISAALWCADLGLSVAVIERESDFGGQLLWTFGPIQNYLGIEAANGPELRDRFVEQLTSREVTRFSAIGVDGVDLPGRTITLEDGRELAGEAIVIATGVRRRTLGVPGEREFVSRGILESGQKSRNEVAGKRVVIIGGGDAALENALILGETATKVTVVHRRASFSARSEFMAAAGGRPNVEFRYNSTVAAIIGNERVEGVDISDVATGETARINCDHVLIRVGVVPNTDMFAGALEMDEKAYLVVSADCSTSLAGVYAVGDVACPLSPTISTAVGMGATAAKAITARFVKHRERS